VIETGRHTYRFVPTPHLPHGWDAGVLFEEKLGVLLCSDLFHQLGDVESVTSADVLGRWDAAVVPSLTASVARARQALGGFDDARMGAMWRLQSGGRDLLAMPRVALVRAIMLNHWYHHRGQLLVYLRMLNQSVPSVYGPTADENPFAA